MSERDTFVHDLSLVDTYVFDYGGVVSHHYCEPWQGNLSALLGVDSKTVNDLLSETSPHGKAYRLGRITQEEFWNEVMSLAGQKSLDIDDLADNWARSYQINHNMVQVIDRLRSERGFQVGVMMNTDEHRHKHIEREYKLSARINILVSSFLYAVTKPDPEAYHTVLRLADRVDTPEKVIYVDDRKRNVSPCVELGMQGYVYSSFEEFFTLLLANQVLSDLEEESL